MTDMPPFTPRNVTKFVIKSSVQFKTAALTRTAIAARTSLESNDLPVVVAGGVVGWYVSEKVSPVTDRAVDTTADFVISKRAHRRARKSAKKSETE